MRAPAAIAISLFAQISSVSAQPLEDNLKIIYPKTERTDVTEEHFGQTVKDSYRWLENDAPDDRAVSAWIAAQNVVTQDYLDTIPGRDQFKKRMKELLDYDRHTVPQKRGDRYFFNLLKGLANQQALFVREGIFGESRLLIDPNTWSQDGADALGPWTASDDGRHVAFSVQKGGTDWQTIKVLDVETGKELEDEVQ
jgi:prolyl oligopeptidase